MQRKLRILEQPCCAPGAPPLRPSVAESLAARFKALADPARVAIVNRLAGADEVCVCEFRLGLSQPTVSHHLRILREAGLVTKRIQGARGYARLRKDDVDRRFPGLLDSVLNADTGARV